MNIKNLNNNKKILHYFNKSYCFIFSYIYSSPLISFSFPSSPLTFNSSTSSYSNSYTTHSILSIHTVHSHIQSLPLLPPTLYLYIPHSLIPTTTYTPLLPPTVYLYIHYIYNHYHYYLLLLSTCIFLTALSPLLPPTLYLYLSTTYTPLSPDPVIVLIAQYIPVAIESNGDSSS